MRRTPKAVLGATLVVAACGLAGCGADQPAPAPSSPSQPASSSVAAPSTPVGAPLPAPQALTDVIARLADPALPADQKVALVQFATADDAAGLDAFGRALRDAGFSPVTVDARDLAWAPAHPGNVLATIVITSATPQPGGQFTFPMEFSPDGDTWQLTGESADLLLSVNPTPTGAPR